MKRIRKFYNSYKLGAKLRSIKVNSWFWKCFCFEEEFPELWLEVAFSRFTQRNWKKIQNNGIQTNRHGLDTEFALYKFDDCFVRWRLYKRQSKIIESSPELRSLGILYSKWTTNNTDGLTFLLYLTLTFIFYL